MTAMNSNVPPDAAEEIQVPYLTWPPFPSPPQGVTIIPFKDFKPKGVIVVQDLDEEEEFDAEGIHTIKLPVEHCSLEEKAARERAKRAKKRKLAQSQGAGESADLKAYWYEAWEDVEAFRHATPTNPMMNRADRFTSIMNDFLTNRKFPTNVQSIFDHFRVFTGMIDKTAPPNSKKNKSQEDQEGVVSDDDGGDDGDDDNGHAVLRKVVPTKSSPGKKHPTGDDLEAHDRTELFLDDIVKSMKIFLSSYYRDKGLFWSRDNLRDGPVLMEFVIKFIIRHRTFPEYDRQLKQALLVIEQAKKELTFTPKIAEALPEQFGQACVAVWGSESDREVAREWEKAYADSEKTKLPEPPIPEEEEPLVDAEDKAATEMDVDGASDDQDKLEGAPEPTKSANIGGWGEIHTFDNDPITEAPNWEVQPAPKVDEYFAPSMDTSKFPENHVIVRSERSTRQIVSFEPPNPTAPVSLRHKLSIMVMEPWKKTNTHSLTSVPPPTVITDNSSEYPSLEPHVPSETPIRVLVDPSLVELLNEREGIAISAVWVQVAEKPQDVNAGETEAPAKKKSKGKSKSKSSSADAGKSWWYLESSNLILPSFWTEHMEEELTQAL